MSKANVQTTTSQAKTADGAIDGQAAVVSSAQAPEAKDAHHGQGGLYTVVDGKRVQVHATKSTHEKAKQ